MTLADQVDRDMVGALKGGDATRLATLRLLKTAAKNAQVAKRAPLTDEEYLDVIRRQAKMRREAAAEYDRASRPVQADQERAELAILEAYLPQQLDVDSVRTVVAAAIVEASASGPGDMGKVMSVAMRSLRGKADGTTVNQIARELLAQAAGQ